jgi:hypothetical protein
MCARKTSKIGAKHAIRGLNRGRPVEGGPEQTEKRTKAFGEESLDHRTPRKGDERNNRYFSTQTRRSS